MNNKPDFFSNQVREAKRFFFDLKLKNEEKISIISGGFENCTPDYEIHRKNFPYLSIEYIVSGQGSVMLNKNKYNLTPGIIFSYGPHIEHHIQTDPEKHLVKYFIDFKGNRGNELLKEASLIPGSIIKISSLGEITSIFNTIIVNGQKGTVFSKRICILLLEYLLLKIIETTIPVDHADSRAFATFQKCCTYIEKNVLTIKNLEQIAHDCSIDKAYLCRLFKRFHHQSPYYYLNKLKMAYAAERLQEPDALIKQIASELHFSDAFHFSRIFKSYYGVPPRQFINLRC